MKGEEEWDFEWLLHFCNAKMDRSRIKGILVWKKMEFYIQITFYIIPDINSYLEKYLILVIFCLSTRTYLRVIIPCLIPKKVLLFLSPF